MDGGIYQCKPFYRRFQEKVWGYARGNITITMYLGNRLLRWLVIFFYFIINYAGKQNQFVLYYIMRTCFFTHHMHLFAIVNWVACSSLMGYLVHRYIVSISVRQRIRPTTQETRAGFITITSMTRRSRSGWARSSAKRARTWPAMTSGCAWCIRAWSCWRMMALFSSALMISK